MYGWEMQRVKKHGFSLEAMLACGESPPGLFRKRKPLGV